MSMSHDLGQEPTFFALQKGKSIVEDNLLEQKVNFLLTVRAAVKRNQVVIIILYNIEDD